MKDVEWVNTAESDVSPNPVTAACQKIASSVVAEFSGNCKQGNREMFKRTVVMPAVEEFSEAIRRWIA